MHRLKRSLLFLVPWLWRPSLRPNRRLKATKCKRVGTHIELPVRRCNGERRLQHVVRPVPFLQARAHQDFPDAAAGHERRRHHRVLREGVRRSRFSAPTRTRSFWVVPYLALAPGRCCVCWSCGVCAATKTLRPATGGTRLDDDPDLRAYRDPIEKDTEKLN